jgi:tetratricopeptide (TPR) repeat protein
MRTTPLLLAISLLSAACGSAPPDETTPLPDPAADEKKAVDEATNLCMQGIQRKADVRAEAIDKLQAVTEIYPDNARASFFLGMCTLVTVAEEGNIGAAFEVDKALTRANELDPADARIEGNMWLTRFNIAYAFKNKPNIDAALAGLTKAADADIFSNFILSLAFSRMDVASGYPAEAVKRLEALLTQCPSLDYCKNTPVVIHHDPALYMQVGDAYVRVGDKAKAAGAYAKALAAPGVDTWAIAAEAKVWADAVDERIMLHADADPSNDPDYFFSGPRTCSGCHG